MSLIYIMDVLWFFWVCVYADSVTFVVCKHIRTHIFWFIVKEFTEHDRYTQHPVCFEFVANIKRWLFNGMIHGFSRWVSLLSYHSHVRYFFFCHSISPTQSTFICDTQSGIAWYSSKHTQINDSEVLILLIEQLEQGL